MSIVYHKGLLQFAAAGTQDDWLVNVNGYICLSVACVSLSFAIRNLKCNGNQENYPPFIALIYWKQQLDHDEQCLQLRSEVVMFG